jgi:hypothetical protein
MAISGLKYTYRNATQAFPGPLIHCVEAKSRVSSDWLTSSSKLQSYLELCRFTQTLLKIKVARWKVHSLMGNYQRDLIYIFFRMDGVLLEVRNRKEGCCA